MASKVLFTATIDGHIRAFHIPYLKWFKEQGFEVHVAAKGNEELDFCDKKFDIPFVRNPIAKENVRAYRYLKKLIDEQKYKLIHCHTPTAATLTRLASIRARQVGTKVFYTAHGFHVFKGASIKNWIIFFPIEKILSKFTDCLITINQQDFEFAKKRFASSNNRIGFSHGVGVDLEKFKPLELTEIKLQRQELGYKMDDFILVYPAEISARKNQVFLVDVIEALKGEIENLVLILAGRGDFTAIQQIIKARQLQDYIQFLGFKKNIHRYIQIADLGISSSKQEGLPLNLLEAMATGKPVVATKVRGNIDLIENGVNGFLVDLDDTSGMASRISQLYKDPELRQSMGECSIKLSKKFSLRVAMKDTIDLYLKVLNEDV